MEPLAARLRPQSLADFVGQTHLVGPGKPLREAMERQHHFSFILWGPPGVGKTTLARLYANSLNTTYHELSAVSASKADIKKLLHEEADAPPVLFLDEIHRFNKAQQDFLLPYVESGALLLIGSTTENPSFEVIPALLSRCRVFTLQAFSDEEMAKLLDRTNLPLATDTREWLIRAAAGDARQALTLIDETHALYDEITIDTLQEAIQSQHLRYDKKGEDHYNTISAFIKSLRASNVDAALYYLARMTESGEDPKFIARRTVIFASEDIGMAQPTALVVANAVFQAVETIGYPECSINLAHGVVYLATAKKDRRAYDGLRAAEHAVRKHGHLPIPLSLRNAPTKLMKESGHGKGYELYPEPGTNLLPEKLREVRFYKE